MPSLRHHIGPPPTERAACWLLLVLIVVLLMFEAACGAEPDKRPELWIHSDPQICTPCKVLHKAIEAHKLDQFRIGYVNWPGVPMPCLAYRNASGQWVYKIGWSKGHETKFLEEWKHNTRKAVP
jgi:hypothetical protein